MIVVVHNFHCVCLVNYQIIINYQLSFLIISLIEKIMSELMTILFCNNSTNTNGGLVLALCVHAYMKLVTHPNKFPNTVVFLLFSQNHGQLEPLSMVLSNKFRWRRWGSDGGPMGVLHRPG